MFHTNPTSPERTTLPMYLYAFLLIALLTSCGQTTPTPTPERHTLQAVGGQPLPATVIDKIYEDPGVPPYRFRVIVLEGWFKLEGNQYQQEVVFRDIAEGYPTRRWIWSEFGTCTPSGDKLHCESGFIQNYRFEITPQDNTLNVQQDFTDPALQATYTFRR